MKRISSSLTSWWKVLDFLVPASVPFIVWLVWRVGFPVGLQVALTAVWLVGGVLGLILYFKYRLPAKAVFVEKNSLWVKGEKCLREVPFRSIIAFRTIYVPRCPFEVTFKNDAGQVERFMFLPATRISGITGAKFETFFKKLIQCECSVPTHT